MVAAAHVGVLALLISLSLVPFVPPVSTLMVHLVAPAPTAPVEAAPLKLQPVERKPLPLRPTPTSKPQPALAAAAETATATNEVAVARDTPPPAPPAAAPVTQPRFDADYLSNPAPHYPPLSRRMSEEGKVVLRVHVESNGRPSQIEIRTSSGSSRLDNAAQEAVTRWKFVPARRGDEAIAAWVLVPIVFNLKS